MSENLKPCPFCGGEAIICGNNEFNPRHWVMCRACHACPVGDVPNLSDAISNWNRRERMTGTPSKDRAKVARDLAWIWAHPGAEGQATEQIEHALATFFAEGMKRAAEIARRQAKFHLDASAMSLPVEPSPIIAKDRAKIATIIAEAIISEAEAC